MLEQRNTKSRGLRFDSSRGFRSFLCPTLVRGRKPFPLYVALVLVFCVLKPSQLKSNTSQRTWGRRDWPQMFCNDSFIILIKPHGNPGQEFWQKKKKQWGPPSLLLGGVARVFEGRFIYHKGKPWRFRQKVNDRDDHLTNFFLPFLTFAVCSLPFSRRRVEVSLV